MPIDTVSTARNVQYTVEDVVRRVIDIIEGMPKDYNLYSGINHDNRNDDCADPELVFKIMVDREIFDRRKELPQIYDSARIRYFVYEDVQALSGIAA